MGYMYPCSICILVSLYRLQLVLKQPYDVAPMVLIEGLPSFFFDHVSPSCFTRGAPEYAESRCVRLVRRDDWSRCSYSSGKGDRLLLLNDCDASILEYAADLVFEVEKHFQSSHVADYANGETLGPVHPRQLPQ